MLALTPELHIITNKYLNDSPDKAQLIDYEKQLTYRLLEEYIHGTYANKIIFLKTPPIIALKIQMLSVEPLKSTRNLEKQVEETSVTMHRLL